MMMMMMMHSIQSMPRCLMPRCLSSTHLPTSPLPHCTRASGHVVVEHKSQFSVASPVTCHLPSPPYLGTFSLLIGAVWLIQCKKEGAKGLGSILLSELNRFLTASFAYMMFLLFFCSCCPFSPLSSSLRSGGFGIDYWKKNFLNWVDAREI